MEAIQKLAVPLSIVIAGAMIAAAVFISNASRPAPVANGGDEPVVQQEIRGVQDTDHILGSKDAKIILVEYSDTECPFCKQFHDTLQRIIKEYGPSKDVAWVYRNFPLEQLHPKAPKEAEALECAAELGGNEKFWAFTNAVYASAKSNNSMDIGVYNVPEEVPMKPDGTPYYTQSKPKGPKDAGMLTTLATQVGLDGAAFEDCLASGRHADRVNADLEEAAAAGGRGTPHSILIVGDQQIPIEGAQPYQNVKAIIDAQLKK